MYRILIADTTPYGEILKSAYTEAGYDATLCSSAFDAISKLNAYDYDMVVSEVELPGDNAFELYEYINDHYPSMPMIMVSGRNIDLFFDRIFNQGIGNVLCKPVEKRELMNLTEKLIKKSNIFGLNNYLYDIIELKRIRINTSQQINRAIDLTIAQIEGWGFTINNATTLTLMLNELAINAVYHSHGFTTEKLRRIPVVLDDGKFVDMMFCRTSEAFAVSITDYNGKLTKAKILESIHSVIEQNILIEQSYESGEDVSDFISETGRGLDLVRKLSGEYYFIIKKEHRTEVILVFKKYEKQSNPESSSLKIIEDF